MAHGKRPGSKPSDPRPIPALAFHPETRCPHSSPDLVFPALGQAARQDHMALLPASRAPTRARYRRATHGQGGPRGQAPAMGARDARRYPVNRGLLYPLQCAQRRGPCGPPACPVARVMSGLLTGLSGVVWRGLIPDPPYPQGISLGLRSLFRIEETPLDGRVSLAWRNLARTEEFL